MIAGGPEVQLGVAQPSTASDISEIERPNLKGVRASVFYSIPYFVVFLEFCPPNSGLY